MRVNSAISVNHYVSIKTPSSHRITSHLCSHAHIRSQDRQPNRLATHTHTMATADQQQQKARYVVLGDTKDILCKKTAFHSVLGQTIDHLTCHVRQYQDPTKPKAEWRKQVVLSKYQAAGTDADFTTTNKAPIQCLNFGGKSFQTVISTMNQYVFKVHKCLERYINKKIIPSSSSRLHHSPTALAADVEDFLHESGLVVNECIPTTLKEVETNKLLKGLSEHAAITAGGGEPLRPPKSRSDMFWTCITSFTHPQTNENMLDEMYGRLVRTHRWGEKGSKLMQWWGVECLLHRWSNDNQRIVTPTQILTLTPTETLCLLTYITEPYSSNGRKHNCLEIHWPDLLNDTVTNYLCTDQGGSSSDSSSKLKAHLSEGDDSTIYLHSTTDDGSPPEMMLTDFASLVEAAAVSSSSSPIRAITLPPTYVPPGQPPNAPIRKTSKKIAATSFIVNSSSSSSSSDDEDDDDNVPLKKYVAAAKKNTKKRRQGQDQNNGGAAPPQKKQKPTTTQKKPATAASKKSFQVIKQWNKDEATPPPSDNDDADLAIVEGESYIKEGNGYTTDENEIEPSQMDKIIT